MMEEAVVLGGFGGQGLLFAGQVLAHAAMLDGLEVSWLPSYGPEMRGGTASCTVILADAPIGSPIVDRATAVVALNPPSLAKYEPMLEPGGVLVLNDSLIEAEPARSDVEVVRVPCTRLAREAGDDRAVAIVALGALFARRSLVSAASVDRALEALLGIRHPAAVDVNRRAIALGGSAATQPAVTPGHSASTGATRATA